MAERLQHCPYSVIPVTRSMIVPIAEAVVANIAVTGLAMTLASLLSSSFLQENRKK
jgi:hypothetical protein